MGCAKPAAAIMSNIFILMDISPRAASTAQYDALNHAAITKILAIHLPEGAAVPPSIGLTRFCLTRSEKPFEGGISTAFLRKTDKY